MSKIHLYIKDQNIINIPQYESIYYKQFIEFKNKSVESVYILDVLDYLDLNSGQELLKAVYDKLVDGGELIIQGPDFNQLMIAINFNKINSYEGKKIIYDKRIYMHSLEEILNKTSRGFECMIKRYINIFDYYIHCKKHE